MKLEHLNYVVDKTGWGDGPWMNEPDRVDFHHAGFACLLLRNKRSGNWCGYVGVPSDHPDYGQDVDYDVHGGITYANKCDGERICHVAAPEEADDLWWLGFDCHHSWDFAPGHEAITRSLGLQSDDGDVYRDVAYTRNQTEHLAEQLAEASRGSSTTR